MPTKALPYFFLSILGIPSYWSCQRNVNVSGTHQVKKSLLIGGVSLTGVAPVFCRIYRYTYVYCNGRREKDVRVLDLKCVWGSIYFYIFDAMRQNRPNSNPHFSVHRPVCLFDHLTQLTNPKLIDSSTIIDRQVHMYKAHAWFTKLHSPIPKHHTAA